MIVVIKARQLQALHLVFIQRQGMSLPIGATKAPRGMKFFPNFALRDLLMWLIALSALLALALFCLRRFRPLAREAALLMLPFLTLAQIGELLGYKSPETTKIYTKVDLEALRTLALPWLGGVR